MSSEETTDPLAIRERIVTELAGRIVTADNEFCQGEAPHICGAMARSGGVDYMQWCAYDGDGDWGVDLPPAAQPGMWAVLLRVAS